MSAENSVRKVTGRSRSGSFSDTGESGRGAPNAGWWRGRQSEWARNIGQEQDVVSHTGEHYSRSNSTCAEADVTRKAILHYEERIKQGYEYDLSKPEQAAHRDDDPFTFSTLSKPQKQLAEDLAKSRLVMGEAMIDDRTNARCRLCQEWQEKSGDDWVIK